MNSSLIVHRVTLFALAVVLHAVSSGSADEARRLGADDGCFSPPPSKGGPRFFFPPPGEALENQERRRPSDAGLKPEVIEQLRAQMKGGGRWALWRYGFLVHVEGDFNAVSEVKSLRKTWHALTVGAAIHQGRIPSYDQKLSVWNRELTGKDARATWWHVITQTSGFDYPYGDHPAYEPGAMWTYSDKNPRHLSNALARVWGKKDYRDHYSEVVRKAYFEAIGMRGWKTSARQDGIRFHFDLEDMGRLGLLVVARGCWRGEEVVPRDFVAELESKQTRGAKVNYDGPDDGKVGLDPRAFPEAPYGFMTWVNTDGDYYPGADRAWAFAAGAGGSYLLWNHKNGIVFAGFGVETGPKSRGIPHTIEACLTGDPGELPAREPTGTAAPTEGPKLSVIRLDLPGPQDVDDSTGGIVVADVNGDRRGDFLVTTRGHLAVYDNGGGRLWSRKLDIVVGGQSESQGLPGHHGPGVAAGDVDGDGRTEVVYLTRDGVLHVAGGGKGEEKASSRPPVPDGAVRWELAMIANFRGTRGAHDVLLQATNEKGYRTGRYLAAYAYDDLVSGRRPLWTTDAFVSCAHNGARLADLDGDGRDEVLGATLFSATGRMTTKAAPFRGHMDSVFVADVRPDLPGLEVILLEEGSNFIQLLGMKGPIWREHHRTQEPQNAAIGRFRAGSDEIFIWCRTRYNEHQRPFVLDARGKTVFEYRMDDVAPKGWTVRGVEVIHTIDWTGERHQLACAKERHESGDVGLFEPLTGKFVERIPERTDRLYVYDVRGDWREEVIVLSGSELHIYENTAPNPRPGQKRLWENRNYRRLKQCHNYYSP